MEYLGCCSGMDIPRLPVSLDQALIPGHMGQNTQFDLGIIGICKNIALFRDKYLSYLTSQFHTHRNVLQVWLCTADTARSCYSLVKFSMDTAVFADIICKAFCIGRI